MHRKRRQKHRKRLFNKQKGKCHYCGCDMLNTKVASGEKTPNNLCTIDEQNWIACCFKCNTERNQFFQININDKLFEWIITNKKE